MGYHSLKRDGKSSYLATFIYHFGRYRYLRLSFGADSTDDMFQRKIEKLFIEIPIVFAITDDILVVDYYSDCANQ